MDGRKVEELCGIVNSLSDAASVDQLPGADLASIYNWIDNRGAELASILLAQADPELLAVANAMGSIQPDDFSSQPLEAQSRLSLFFGVIASARQIIAMRNFVIHN
jgi:hypothetical protein